MSQKQTFSWPDILKDCQTVAEQIQSPIDLIVAITKGGLPIATVLANKYLNNPPIITLQLKEIQTEGQANYQAKQVKLISPLNIYPIKAKTVLLLDDVADTGNTLKTAAQLVNQQQPKTLITACLHYKPRSSIKPDIFARKISNQTWIVYPWE